MTVFTYLFLAVLSWLLCGLSLVAARGGYSLVVVHASLCSGFSSCRAQALGCMGFRSRGSQALEHKLSSCGAWPQLLCSMQDLLRSRINPVSHALAGGFFTTEPPGKLLDGALRNKYLQTPSIQSRYSRYFSSEKSNSLISIFISVNEMCI